MEIEKLKELVIELEKLEELSLEEITELELKYQVLENFISEIHFEIKVFKTKIGECFNFDAFLSYLESNLIEFQGDYEYYRDLIATLDLDNEMLAEVNYQLQLIELKIKKLEKFLGYSNKKNKSTLLK